MESSASFGLIKPASLSKWRKMTSITVAGIRSPLIDAGTAGASEAIVFVHGNPGSSRDWEDLIRRVSPFARAVAFDMPGFGRADKPKVLNYTIEGYARHLGAALAALNIERTPCSARLRRRLGVGVGGDESTGFRKRHADQYRHPARLSLALPREDLAHACRRRDL
jgi:pimeloyl-ACP methyl ester carboxylesterase